MLLIGHPELKCEVGHMDIAVDSHVYIGCQNQVITWTTTSPFNLRVRESRPPELATQVSVFQISRHGLCHNASVVLFRTYWHRSIMNECLIRHTERLLSFSTYLWVYHQNRSLFFCECNYFDKCCLLLWFIYLLLGWPVNHIVQLCNV